MTGCRLNVVLLMTVIALLALGNSCVSQKEYDEIKAENERLSKELEECEHGAEKSLERAQTYFKEKELEKAKAELTILLAKHPASDEAARGRILLDRVRDLIDKAEKEEKTRREEAEKAEQRRIADAVRKMHKSYDEFNETAFYQDMNSPRYTNKNGIFLVFEKDDDSDKVGSMLLKIQYCASDWLFVESYQFLVDGKGYSINPIMGILRDTAYGSICEWSAEPVVAVGLPFLNKNCEVVKAIIESKEAKIRFVGEHSHVDKSISAQQKAAMRNVVDAYKALGGEADCL